MDRRAFLLSAVGGAVATAGCAGLPGGGETRRTPYAVDEPVASSLPDVRDGPESIPRSPARVDSSAPDRTLVVPRIPFVSGSGGLGYEYGFERPGSERSPPVLRIAAINRRPDPLELEFGPTPPFSGYVGAARSGESELAFVALADAGAGSFDGGCWRLPDGAVPAGGRTTLSLEPGEVVTERYALFTPGEVEACLPPGEYRFPNPTGQWSLYLHVWEPDRIRPPPTRFDDGLELPSPPDPAGDDRAADADVAVDWFHEADPKTRVYVAPETEAVERSGRPVGFELHNYSTNLVEVDRRDARVFRLAGGSWIRVDRPGRSPNRVTIRPGSSDVETVSLGAASPPDGISVAGARPGLYAYDPGRVTRRVDGERERLRPVAAFEVTEGTARGG